MDNKGNIYFFQHNETSLVITLECRCALYTPQWILHEIGSEEFIASHDPVKCVKNGEDCSPVSYISASNAMSGYYLYQTSTFNVNQTTVLMCSSTNDKTAVVVSLKGNSIFIFFNSNKIERRFIFILLISMYLLVRALKFRLLVSLVNYHNTKYGVFSQLILHSKATPTTISIVVGKYYECSFCLMMLNKTKLHTK